MAKKFDYRPYLKRFKIFQEEHPSQDSISFVFSHYIKQLLQQEKLGSALNYQSAYNALKKFRGNVRLKDITVTWTETRK